MESFTHGSFDSDFLRTRPFLHVLRLCNAAHYVHEVASSMHAGYLTCKVHGFSDCSASIVVVLAEHADRPCTLQVSYAC